MGPLSGKPAFACRYTHAEGGYYVVARHPPLNSSYNPFTQVNRIGTHAIQYTKLGSLFLPDAVSGGRLQFGVGAGWQEREHGSFGYALLDTRQRLNRFAEALDVMTRLLRSDEPVTWEGEFYQLRDALLLPRPQRRGGPPVVIGGNGPQRTLPLTARFADEWNSVFVPAAKFAELNARLDELIEQQGRAPGSVRRSLMTNIRFGRDDAEVQRRLRGQNRAEMRERGVVVGTAHEVVEQLGEYADAGVQRIMLQ